MARSTLARHRNLFSRDPEEGGGGGGPEGGQNNEGKLEGKPEAKPEKTFTQAEVNHLLGERAQRERAKFSDYDELKTKAKEADELRKQLETDSEKAIREAREAAIAEERKTSAPRLVGAEFRAAAKGVLTDAQRDAFLEDADLTKYLKDNGEVDVDKVTKKVEALAPAKSEKETTRRVPRDMGQGNRSEGGKISVSSAREDYLERRRKKATSNT